MITEGRWLTLWTSNCEGGGWSLPLATDDLGRDRS